MGLNSGVFFFNNSSNPNDTLKSLETSLESRKGGVKQSELVTNNGINGCLHGTSQFTNDRLSVQVDGQIYNDLELKETYGLSGTEQGEIVAELYASKGERFIDEINGDFSIFILDKQNLKGHLYRDRYGVKTVYYSFNSDFVAFSPEPKGLFATGLVSKELNLETVYNYVGTHYRYVYFKPERTFFQEVIRVPQGTKVTIDFKNGTVESAPYWKFEMMDLSKKDPKDIQAEYLERLRAAVKRRLKDCPYEKTAFTLSGGMDSSSVCALSAEYYGKKLEIYSSGFEQKEYDESDGIAPSRDAFAEKWHNIIIDGHGLADTLREMVKRFDEPVPTVTYYSNYRLHQQAKAAGVDYFFSGLGGDEGNSGEYEHFFYFFADLRKRGLEDRLEEEVKYWAKYHDHPIFKKNWDVVNKVFTELVDFENPYHIGLDKDRYDFYKDVYSKDFINRIHYYPTMPAPLTGYLANRVYHDLIHETIPTCLNADDRISSTFAMQDRYPFFDHTVLQYAFSVPVELRYNKGVTKALMRDMMRGILPDATVDNFVKVGWNAPMDHWMRAEFSDYILDMIHHPNDLEKELFNLDVIKKLYEDHFSGKTNHMMFFWQYVNFRIFYENCILEKQLV